MLALPYLKTRIQNFQANGGKIQDQKYARDAIVIIYLIGQNLGWDDRIEEPFCRPSIATNEEPSNASRICYS